MENATLEQVENLCSSFVQRLEDVQVEHRELLEYMLEIKDEVDDMKKTIEETKTLLMDLTNKCGSAQQNRPNDGQID